MNQTEIRHLQGLWNALLAVLCALAGMAQMMAGPLSYGQQIPQGFEGDLSILKNDGVTSVVAGNNLTYTLTVINNGLSASTGGTVTDILPAGLTFVSSASGCTESNGTVTCPFGAIADGETTELSFVAAVDPGQTSDIDNTATVVGNEADPLPGNNTANHVTPVTAEADLSITKDDGVTSVVPGSNLTYTLTVTNNGPSDSSGGTINDPLPLDLTFVSSASGCTENSPGNVFCTFNSLADGANTVMTFVTAVADPAGTNEIDNPATVTGNETDPTAGNDSANHLTPVAPAEADLAIVKDDGVASVVPGTNLTYTLTVTNNGPSNSSGGTISDDLPTGLTFVSSASGCTETAGTVTCAFGSLANGADTGLTFVAAVDSGQTDEIDNTATVTGNETDPTSGNDSANHVTPVASAEADLSIVKDDGVTSVVPGTNLTYTLTVTNNGLSNSSGGTISDDLPTGLTFVSSASGCTETAGTVTCPFGSLANGADTGLTFVAAVDSGQTDEIDNTATVTGNETDPISGNDSANHVTPVASAEADLSIVKDDGVTSVVPGTNLTYTLTISNNGPSNSSGGTISDDLPAGLTFVSSATGCTEMAGTVTCAFGSIVDGEEVLLSFVGVVDADQTTAINNTATVIGNEADPSSDNDSSSHTTEITANEADLELVKDDGVNEAEPGTNLSYTLTVTNHGPRDSSGGNVRDPLPAGLRFLASGTGCRETSGIVNCPFGRLAVGRSRDLKFSVHIEPAFADGFPALPADFLRNTATVEGNEVDPDTDNNDASLETDLILVGDLNNDTVLDGRDASILIQELSDRGPAGTVPQGDDPFDLNQDSLVDQDDLVFLVARLLRKPLPSAENDVEGFVLGVEEPPPSRLDFPRLNFEEGESTGVAIVNLNPVAADVLFTAYDQDGQILARESLNVPAGEQLAQLIPEIFGVLDPTTIGWFRATSSTPNLTGFFLDFNQLLSELDGADLPQRARRIVFNKIRIDESFSTELNIINTGELATELSLTLMGGEEPIQQTLELPPKGMRRLDVSTFFGDVMPAGMPPLPTNSYVLAEAGQSLIGFEMIRSGTGDFEGLNARSALDFLNRIYLPQMVALGPFEATVGLVNYSEQPVLATLFARKPDGTLFTEASQNPVTVLLEPGQSLLEDVAELFGFQGGAAIEGSMEIVADSQAVNGYFSYGIPGSGAATALAAVCQPKTSAVFSHLGTVPGFFTGIAALNSASLPANIRILAASPQGQILGSFYDVLEPGQRISRLVSDIIPAADNQSGGFIFVRSNVPIFLTSLFGTNDGRVLSNVPPQDIPFTVRPDAELPQARVLPPLSVLQPDGQTQFTAEGLSEAFDWTVNGFVGGTDSLGTIDDNGLYSAPGAALAGLPVTIAAQTESITVSASVDIISPQTLLENLGQVQSVAFLESIGRLFIAELIVSDGPSSAVAPSGGVASEIYSANMDDRRLLVRLEGEDIQKILAFEAPDESQFLLASATNSGTILRVDPVSGDSFPVAEELDRPSTMVLDPQTGNLLVATPTEIVTLTREALEQGLSPQALAAIEAPEFPRPRQGVMIDLADVSGLAVDQCTGNILLAQRDNNRLLSFSRSDGEISVLVDGLLAGPSELLILYRAGVGCPYSTTVFIVEEGADQISVYVPHLTDIPEGGAEDLLLSPWVPAEGPMDLTLLPPHLDFGPDQSLLASQLVGVDSGSLITVDIPLIFQAVPDNPPVNQVPEIVTSPPGPDLAISTFPAAPETTGGVDLFFRDGDTAAAILLLTLDYDENLLQLADGTLAGSVISGLPAGMTLIGFYDPAATERELAFLIADLSAPFTTLTQGTALQLLFAVARNVQGNADVYFKTPGPQLIDLSGSIIPLDEIVNGGVQVRP